MTFATKLSKKLAESPTRGYTGGVENTRERILRLVVERREARVEELADELGISAAAVRRHLDNLRADGLVSVRTVKQATGRPYYCFVPTDAAIEAMQHTYVDLLQRLLQCLGEREEVASAVAAAVAEAVAARHRGEVAAADPIARVAEVTESLRREGILDSWRAEADGIHLVNAVCPYRQVAEHSRLPCESDRRAIELLLGTTVEQIHRIVDGGQVCEYVVRTEASPMLESRV